MRERNTNNTNKKGAAVSRSALLRSYDPVVGG